MAPMTDSEGGAASESASRNCIVDEGHKSSRYGAEVKMTDVSEPKRYGAEVVATNGI